MKIQEDELYTTKEVAEMLKISLPTVKRLIKDGSLPSIRIGKQHRFLGKELIEIIFDRRGIPVGEGRAGASSVKQVSDSPAEGTVRSMRPDVDDD